jgi:hypothetical protein
MGGNSPVATRGCRAVRKLIIAAVALGALAVPFAGTAAAQPAAVPVVNHQSVQDAGGLGLTLPSAAVETPDGAVWVSDELYGVCRVTASGLVESAFCAPEPLEPADGTPLPVVEDLTRPTVARQIAFDPATENFYAAEGSSAGSGVWRMHWDTATGAIDGATKIYDSTAGDDRVFGLALTAAGDVVFSSKRTTNIRRIANPAAIASPLDAGNVTTIGFSLNGEATSLAVLGSTVYLADGGLLTRIDGGTGVAVPVGGQGTGTAIVALAADRTNQRLYAGTSNASLVDTVLSYTEAGGFGQAPYAAGFTNVTGLGVGAGGGVYVAQDATGSLTPSVEGLGMADLFLRPFSPADLPVVRFRVKPRVATNHGPWAFAFVAAANATDTTRFECRLDDGDAYDCTAPQYTAAGDTTIAELDEGAHSLKVRATNDAPDAAAPEWGPMAEWVFAVDQTAPAVTIDNDPADTRAVGGAFRLRFSADDAGPVSYTCALDALDAVPCSPPKDYAGLALGDHTITVVGTDAAGNKSVPATWTVTAVPAPPKPNPVPGPVHGDPPVTPLGTERPVTVPVTPVAPRLEIGVPCVEVSPSRAAARFSLQGRTAIIRFRAPGRARYAKFTLRRAGGERRGVVETLGYARVARTAAAHTTRIALTRGQRSRVRAGRLRLAVAYGTCRTQVGDWGYVTNTTTREGTNR